MAITDRPTPGTLDAIVESTARAIGRHGIKEGKAEGAGAALRVELEENVKRVIQVYWTPFEANIPGSSIGLHLEVAEPRVHWAEAYLSPSFRSWVFCFHERADGDIQLAYHADHPNPDAAVESFFDLATWYVLTATDRSWSEVTYQIGEGVPWNKQGRTLLAGSSMSPGVQESLKKSTIVWLRYAMDGTTLEVPVWFLYDSKAQKVYVLSGERQQTIPGAAGLREVDVIFRWKMKNARVGDVPASVRVLQQGPEWDEVAGRIAEKRLNIPGLPEDTARRWRDECEILELTLLT